MGSYLRGVQARTPGWLADMGQLLVGAGVGGWLTWAGAVAAGTAHLDYWAIPSIIATIALVLGIVLWVLGAEPPMREVLREVLTEFYSAPQVGTGSRPPSPKYNVAFPAGVRIITRQPGHDDTDGGGAQ